VIRDPRTPPSGPLRVMRVLEVRPQADIDGRDLVVLDWDGDGSVGVPARHDRDRPTPGRDDEVLVVIVDRVPSVVCRLSGGAPAA